MINSLRDLFNEHCLRKIDNSIEKTLIKFRKLILEGNKKANITSKNIDIHELNRLIFESVFFERYIEHETVIDAGSGSGIMGIPISIFKRERAVHLVEPREKKAIFLKNTILELELKNVEVHKTSIREFFQNRSFYGSTLIARGFPENEKLLFFLRRNKVSEISIITSENKIKKIRTAIELFKQSIYNIPYRNQIKILKLENVSRETKKK